MLEFDSEINKNKINPITKIKVLGIGGGGGNMVNSMIKTGYQDITFIVANTDAQALNVSKTINKIQLGVKSTKGLGAGANPEIGRRSAEEDIDKIIEAVKDADIVFLAAGLGGGTGSGALPVIARALREKDIFSVAIVTKPFAFEGKRRMKIAQESLELLKKEVDTIIVLQNQKLIDTLEEKVSLIDAFSRANDILNKFILAISDIINKHGQINVDFADLKSIMKQKGYALIGIGKASGSDRAIEAANAAINSPLLENTDIGLASGLLINITGPSDLGLNELSLISSLIYKKAHEDANIIIGSVIDDNLKDEICVTVIATGYSEINNYNIKEKKLANHIANKNSTDENLIINQDGENNNQDINDDINDIDIPAVIRKVIKQKQF